MTKHYWAAWIVQFTEPEEIKAALEEVPQEWREYVTGHAKTVWKMRNRKNDRNS